MFDAINQAILDAVTSPWALVLTFFMPMIDSFFPPVPGEATVIAVAAVSVTGDGPPLYLVLLLAWAGAFIGDNIAFSIGRALGVDWVRKRGGERTNKSLDWIHDTLDHRAPVMIIGVRFIPVVRIAVIMLAGATQLPRRRFMPLDAIGSFIWAGYSVGIGAVAGSWAHDNPLLAITLGVAFATAVGMIIDRIMENNRKRKENGNGSGTSSERDTAATSDAAGRETATTAGGSVVTTDADASPSDRRDRSPSDRPDRAAESADERSIREHPAAD